jgi:hypothetical protein
MMNRRVFDPFLAGVAILVGLCSTGMVAQAADSQETWFLAVGHGGHRMLSRDGKSWEKHVSWGEPRHDQNDLNVAVNFKGAFFAGGGYFSGRLTGTRDGVRWSDGVIPGSSPIFGLEVMDNTLYAIDLRGVVFKSADGEKWELVARSKMPTPTHWIRATTQGKGLIVGSGDFGPVMVFDPSSKSITVTQMAGQKDKQPGLKRVAFGNGVFVIGGQDGLLAITKDGKTWQNNKTDPARGHVFCVEFTGKDFLATTQKGGVLRSADGLTWKAVKARVPQQVRLVHGWLYGYGWPPSKISRSKDGETWEPVPNEKNWQGKNYAFGTLAGGPPPNPPNKSGSKPKK